MERNPSQEDPLRIGGWLILVAFGVTLAPFRIIGDFLMIYGPMISQGTWRVLVTPGSEVYSPFWVPILAFEITYNIAMGAAAIWLALLFFTKHRYFPKLYIAILGASLLGILLDAGLVSLALPEESILGGETSKEFIRTLIVSAIWIPYMLKSERVKATFIR